MKWSSKNAAKHYVVSKIIEDQKLEIMKVSFDNSVKFNHPSNGALSKREEEAHQCY